MDKVDILGVGFDNVTMDEAVIKVLNFLKGDKTTMVVTPNLKLFKSALKISCKKGYKFCGFGGSGRYRGDIRFENFKKTFKREGARL
jgi:hypothetical protein